MIRISFLLVFLHFVRLSVSFLPRHKRTHRGQYRSWRATRLRAEVSSSVGSRLRVGSNIGSGSYGTVYTVYLDGEECVGKRPWELNEIKSLLPHENDSYHKERHNRCKYYWKVEKHCFQKLTAHPGIPSFRGTLRDQEGFTWLLFGKIGATIEDAEKNSHVEPAPCMQDLLELDLLDHQEETEHRLRNLSSALGILRTEPGDFTYLAKTVDAVIEGILDILIHIHRQNIVHRDVKPANLLVANGRLSLIDFGSAADLDTAGVLKANIGLSEMVAISPIYAAPELFVDPSLPRAAVSFDSFSAALIVCQILFQYLDERTDAGFFRQLSEAEYSLDSWLETQLLQDVRSAGLEQGLAVLAERPGLWSLLQRMLLPDPRDRLSTKDALHEWKRIKQNIQSDTILDHATLDGRYLADVLDSFELCSIVDVEPAVFPVARPLHYVATFRRNEPLGLLLAEVDGSIREDMSESDRKAWESVTKDAFPGQVFVQGVVPGSQADQMDIFQVGDRLQGVGELPLAEGGFEKALELIQDQPRNSKFITLHMDRRPSRSLDSSYNSLQLSVIVKGLSVIRDQGAWSSRGRRSSQEDRFVLHEIHDSKDSSLLLAGVFDGHLGAMASEFVSERLPSRVTEIIADEKSQALRQPEIILERAWTEICTEYRQSCAGIGACAPNYDAREGILDAYTGGRDTISGTTGSVVAIDQNQGILAILNCGDSRSVVVDERGEVAFRTQDHQPEFERERFAQGIASGLPYSEPECRFSKWQVAVGDYNYAVSRSLEGPLATSMGIISEPDISILQALPGSIVVVATDGLWEVMDVFEVAKLLHRVRQKRVCAADASKTLCSIALERGSKDNVSCVVVYVD